MKDTTLTLAQPLKLEDGRYVNTIPVAKNQNLFVGIATSNRDRRIWGEDADEWKPERWLSPLPESVADSKSPGIYSHL